MLAVSTDSDGNGLSIRIVRFEQETYENHAAAEVIFELMVSTAPWSRNERKHRAATTREIKRTSESL
jgi:hypothetical protein